MSIAAIPEPGRGLNVRFHSAGEWAEMLARMGEKHARLSRAAERIARTGHRRPVLLKEIEKERARIGRELHAGAGQPLAGIKLNLDVVEDWCQSYPGPIPRNVKEAVGRIERLADSALSQVRAVSHRLHPPDWQNLPVEAALNLLVKESGVTEQCRTTLYLEPLIEEPGHAVRVALYRCAQECISNVLRHSGAKYFSLSLRSSLKSSGSSAARMIHLTIRDDGHGIPEDALKGGGIGLLSIREYTRSIGGVSRITSSGSKGTTIQISLPLTEE